MYNNLWKLVLGLTAVHVTIKQPYTTTTETTFYFNNYNRTVTQILIANVGRSAGQS